MSEASIFSEVLFVVFSRRSATKRDDFAVLRCGHDRWFLETVACWFFVFYTFLVKSFFNKLLNRNPRPQTVEPEKSSEGKVQSPLTSQDEKVLESRPKEQSSLLGGGINTTVYVKLKDDGAGVFKPKSGERTGLRSEIEAGTYYKRERAAYLIDRFLGFDLVPATTIREFDGEEGSLQRFIPEAKTGYDLTPEKFTVLAPQLKKMWIFDCIIANTDRHDGNFLVTGEKVYAIDHGLALSSQTYSTFRPLFDTPGWEEISETIKHFLSWEDGVRILELLLLELLSSEEVSGVLSRIKKVDSMLHEHGTIPRALAHELSHR